MSLELLKQNSEAVLESIDSYDHLIEQRAKSGNKKEIREIDRGINLVKKHILELCKEIEKELKDV